MSAVLDPFYYPNDPLWVDVDWDALLLQGQEKLADVSTMWSQSRQSRALWYQQQRTVTLPALKGKTRWIMRRPLTADCLIVVRNTGRVNVLRGMLLQAHSLNWTQQDKIPTIIALDDLEAPRFQRDFGEIVLLPASRLYNRRDVKWVYRRTQDACRRETVYVALG